jgi:hypothetical protein
LRCFADLPLALSR